MSDRILVTGATGLQGSEMGSEKFSNSAKSGYNKGTIRSDIWYFVVSKDVRRHRLISISYVSYGLCHSSNQNSAKYGIVFRAFRASYRCHPQSSFCSLMPPFAAAPNR